MISSLKSKFQHRGGLSFAFLCLLYGRLYGAIEVCRVEVVALYLPFVRVLSCLW